MRIASRQLNVLFRLPVCFVLCWLATACAPIKPVRVAAVALTVEDVGRAAAKQTDPVLVREGTPAYLMLLDGLLESYPENTRLLTAACQAYATYASSFVREEEQERIALLQRRAMHYGFRSLSGKLDFPRAASGSLEDFTAGLERFDRKDVPALFWTATAWAGWVGSNIGSVEAMADLPFLEAVIRRILELDESYYYGGPHLLMGIFLAAKPAAMGGSLPQAKVHFDRAFAHGGDKVLMTKVYYAQYYARGMRDRELFERTLREVQAASADDPPEMALGNIMAKGKANRLLERTEEYFAGVLE
ncbi:MAG: hypothetical protein GX443_11785 [Deltaproteobacteria bacterium]|nr:hypothetical protein [Deltaproteobacteria bacterium]